jgi:hypothetical protein
VLSVGKTIARYRDSYASYSALLVTSPAELELEFKKIDTNNDGTLTKKEMRSFLSKMDERDFDAMFAAIDIDGSGTVEFTEFCAFVAQVSHGPPTKAAPAAVEPKKVAEEQPTPAAVATEEKADIIDCQRRYCVY